jgi:hypothetical protein
MTTDRMPVVHVVGEYLPACTGTDRISEAQYFKQLFMKSNQNAGATTSFVSKTGGVRFNEGYVERIAPGDVVVLLNPEIDINSFSFRTGYQRLVKRASEKAGRGRTVLAMQDDEVRQRLRLSSQCELWQINYTPVFITTKEGQEVSAPREPVPEEAMEIAAKILRGKNPDVYA